MSEKLRLQYEIVRYHPVMLGTGKNYVSFGKEADKLLDIFYEEIIKKYPQYKFTLFLFAHQFATSAFDLTHCGSPKHSYGKNPYWDKRHEFVVQICQIYLPQVHAFLDTCVFEEMKYHVGRQMRGVGWTCSKHYYVVTYRWNGKKWIHTGTKGDTGKCSCIGKDFNAKSKR